MTEHDRKTHITETPDSSHIKNIDVTHETSDVQVGSIGKFVIALLVLTIATHIVLWGMFRVLQRSETQKEQTQHRSPLAMTGEERLPPEPRLQGAPGFAQNLDKKTPESHEQPRPSGVSEPPRDPMWEIRALNEQWKDVLEHGPVDEHGQRYGMSIEQAKDEALKQLEKQKAEGKKQ